MIGNIILRAPQIRAALDNRLSQARMLAWRAPNVDNLRDLSALETPTQIPSKWLKMHRRFEEAAQYSVEDEYREWLYVRESGAWTIGKSFSGEETRFRHYRATAETDELPDIFDRWVPAIHMPRWASRLTLEVTATKLERLHEISEEDAAASGFEGGHLNDGWDQPRELNDVPGVTIQAMNTLCSAAGMAQIFYAEQYPDPSWDAYSSPECVALIFKVHPCNISEIKEAA